jgi:CheY-like chemotaxis protein
VRPAGVNIWTTVRPAYRRSTSIEVKSATPIVLVVDDEPDVRLLIADSLNLFGYTVIVDRDADEAIRLFRTNRPDIITLDLAMPGRDGHSLVGELDSGAGARGIHARTRVLTTATP